VFLLSGFIKCTLPLIEFWIFCLAFEFGEKNKHPDMLSKYETTFFLLPSISFKEKIKFLTRNQTITFMFLPPKKT